MKIYLENFRSYKEVEFELSPKLTFFVGDNGQGKTNVIEAIYTFFTLGVFRAKKKDVFIKHGADYAKICLDDLEIFWQLMPNRTVFKKNGTKMPTREFLSKKDFFAVLFTPDDLNLPFNSPSYRRRLFSRSIGVINPEYFFAQMQFDKVLLNRNRLLKDEASEDEFHYWDSEFIRFSGFLTELRKEFIDFINQHITEYYAKLCPQKSQLRVDFLKSSKDIAHDLKENFQKDRIIKTTSKGAHRDDFCFMCGDKLLQDDSSRGEMRSAILAFKLAERDYINSKTGQMPLLLFDDVFSELDELRVRAFLGLIQDQQAVITTTLYKEGLFNDSEAVFYRL
jgi:DNA replication and repair protein RecF